MPAPRSIPQLIADTFRLYRRFPLLFLVLAGGVVIPYQLIVLLATGTGSLNRHHESVGIGLLLIVIDWALVGPLVSAMHVQAVAEVRENGTPHISSVARKGLEVLPVVVAAVIMAGLGFLGATLLLVIPGIYVFIRWNVAAQAAAIDHEGWSQALRRSWGLTERQFWRVFGFVVSIMVIIAVPVFLLRIPFAHQSTTVVSVLVGALFQVATVSFAALAHALLYYDLRARREGLASEWRESEAPHQNRRLGEP